MLERCRSVGLRITLGCVVVAQMFAAFPVKAASHAEIHSKDGSPAHAAVLVITPTPALQTLVLQPDSTAGVDTYIYSGSKNSNYGTAMEMGIGEDNTSSNKAARSLIKFDLASIPANATITAATLSLWTSKDLSSNTRTIRVYRLKTSFQEAQATWNGPATGVSWQTAGASGSNDRESTAIGSVSLLSNEALNQEKQIVLQPVKLQEMVSGAFVNRGFILVADTEQNDRFNYHSSDSAASTLRPRLVVQYVVSPVVPSEMPTPTDTPVPPSSSTSSPSATALSSPTVLPTLTSTATIKPSDTPSVTATPTFTASATPMPSSTPSATATRTFTPSATLAPSNTPSATATRTFTPSATQPNTSTPTPTATSTAVGTETKTLTPVPSTMGPLTVSSVNPRYFAKPDGTIVYLTGSHTWCNFMDCGATDPITSTFDYTAFLDFLAAHNHNFFRLWRAENARGGEAGPNFWFNPMPYQRSTTCCAFDGGNKFDLAQFDQVYFDRMRQRVMAAQARGMYVSVMLFDGWSVESKFGGHVPWAGHPYNLSNNINGIDGDMNDDNQGGETQTLSNADVTALQEAYVRKVIDTVNDLDNVLYEISNESTGSPANTAWQYHMIDYIHTYEASKPRQHPVGMTKAYPNASNSDLYNSPADWISPDGTLDNPPVASGDKVILYDTDHLCGICGDRQWVWKSFTRGENPIFMDVYDPATTSRGMYLAPTGNEADIRNNLGYTRAYATRMNLAGMVPQPGFCSSGYCLARAGTEYLAYLPSGKTITIDLSTVSGSFDVEWFNPVSGTTVNGGSVLGGSSRTLTSPFTADAVLYLKSESDATATPQITFTPTLTVSPSPLPTWTGTATYTLTVPPSNTPAYSPTPSGTPPATNTPSRTATATFTSVPVSATPSRTSTATFTPLATNTSTRTPTATFTSLPASSTPSRTPTSTSTSLPTNTPTRTATTTSTPAPTATYTPTPPGSFPLNPVLDNFDRANGVIGTNWSGYTSTFSITSSQLQANTGGWDNQIYWGNATFGANQEAYVTIAQLTSDSWELSLMLKSQNRTSYTSGAIEVFYMASSNTLEVWTYDPTGDWVQYGASIPSLTLAAGDQLGVLSLADGTLQIYKNGTLLATRNLSAWPYANKPGYIGLWFANASGHRLDNFGGGTR